MALEETVRGRDAVTVVAPRKVEAPKLANEAVVLVVAAAAAAVVMVTAV